MGSEVITRGGRIERRSLGAVEVEGGARGGE
jgi:hypothetical protein